MSLVTCDVVYIIILYKSNEQELEQEKKWFKNSTRDKNLKNEDDSLSWQFMLCN